VKNIILFCFGAVLLFSCTSEPIRKEVTQQSDLHGLGYPFTFERAQELREAQKFESAAYVYINLYQYYKDSVIKEVVRMNSEALTSDSVRPLKDYFQKAIASEGYHDANAYDLDKNQKKPRLDTLFRLTSDLLDNLYPYGIK